MKKRSFIGACVMLVAIVVALPLGVHTSLTKLREEAESSYYYDKTGFAIYQGMEEREATANNLITVAKRYTQTNPALAPLIEELDYAVREELKKTELSESDQKYPDQLIAQMESEQDKINRSSYNEDAREFNARLDKFPVKLLLPFAGVQPLGTYDYE